MSFLGQGVIRLFAGFLIEIVLAEQESVICLTDVVVYLLDSPSDFPLVRDILLDKTRDVVGSFL